MGGTQSTISWGVVYDNQLGVGVDHLEHGSPNQMTSGGRGWSLDQLEARACGWSTGRPPRDGISLAKPFRIFMAARSCVGGAGAHRRFKSVLKQQRVALTLIIVTLCQVSKLSKIKCIIR